MRPECHPFGRFLGVYEANKPQGRYEANSVPLFCNRWICSRCGKFKRKRLIARAFNGRIVEPVPGFRSKYGHKLLTLTVPGKAYRAVNTPETALADLNEKWAKLVKVLRKHRGQFDYLKVVELQRDGFPHLHVLLRGTTIADKSILKDIRYYWEELYGMGNVDITYLKSQPPQRMILYILKYLTKMPAHLPKRKRVFVSSRGALAPSSKQFKDWIIKKLLKPSECKQLKDATEFMFSDTIPGFTRFNDPDLTDIVFEHYGHLSLRFPEAQSLHTLHSRAPISNFNMIDYRERAFQQQLLPGLTPSMHIR